MMSRAFYELAPPFPDRVLAVYGTLGWGRRFRTVDWDAGVEVGTIACVARSHLRLGSRIGPLGILLNGVPRSEVVWTVGSEMVVTDSFAQELRAEGFSGIELRPVRVTARGRLKGKQLPVLWEVALTGPAVRVVSGDGLQPLFKCPHCGFEPHSSYHLGFGVDQNSWGGLDFFAPYPAITRRLVSERVKKYVARRQPLNCVLTRTTDMRWPMYGQRPEDLWDRETQSPKVDLDELVAKTREFANSVGFKLKP